MGCGQSPEAKNFQKTPLVFSKEEVTAILASIKNRNHYCLIALSYAAGLRLNEVVHLKPADLDSSRMQIRISAGKGNKDRYTLQDGKRSSLHQFEKMSIPRQ